VQDILKGLPRGRSIVAYSRPETQDRLGVEYDALGHLSLSLLKVRGIPQTADFYLCGPATSLAQLSSDLKSWSVPENRIHSEAFGSGSSMTPGIAGPPAASAHLPAGEVGTGPVVSFTRSGLSVPWNSRFGNILELAEACDVPVRWSCRVGVCHTCQTGVIAGSVRYEPVPLDQPSVRDVLICCAKPASEIELDL